MSFKYSFAPGPLIFTSIGRWSGQIVITMIGRNSCAFRFDLGKPQCLKSVRNCWATSLPWKAFLWFIAMTAWIHIYVRFRTCSKWNRRAQYSMWSLWIKLRCRCWSRMYSRSLSTTELNSSLQNIECNWNSGTSREPNGSCSCSYCKEENRSSDPCASKGESSCAMVTGN